jgi:hypothetical protein
MNGESGKAGRLIGHEMNPDEDDGGIYARPQRGVN